MADQVIGSASGLRGRKKARTRALLRSTALRLAMDSGPDRVSVDQICDAAGISPRTFFNYFPTKDHALFGVDPEHLEAIDRHLSERPDDEAPLDSVEAILSTIIVSATESGIWPAQMALLRAHPELTPRMRAATDAVRHAVTEALARRLGRPADDAYVATLCASALAAMDTALSQWSKQSLSSEQALRSDDSPGTDDSPGSAGSPGTGVPPDDDPRQLLSQMIGYLRSGFALP